MHRLLGLLLLATAGPALASPWAPAGDGRLRADVELLRAHGFITAPASSWPMPWVSIIAGVERARGGPALPPMLEAAVRRLEAEAELAMQPTQVEAAAAATTEPALVRGFDATARAQGEARASVMQDFGRVHLTLGGSWWSEGSGRQRTTERGNGFSLEPSELAIRLGNHALYGGYTQPYWGAGEDGSLLFSTSARPFPKVGIRRLDARTIDLPVLRWLGPVRWDGFVGQLDENRADFDRPLVIGMRVEFAPARGLDIGLNRALQLCGRDRPCGLSTFLEAAVPIGRLDNSGTFDEPGNQLAGFDLAWRLPLSSAGHMLHVHVEAEAEDEANFIIDQFARQLGVRVMGPWGQGGARWRLGAEVSDTLATRLFWGRTWPGSMYNHFIYSDGFTYQGRPIGYSLDGDTRAWSLFGDVVDTANRRWHLRFRHLDLNVKSVPSYRVTRTNERIAQVAGGVDWPTRWGEVRAEIRYQDDRPDTPGRRVGELQAEAGWRTRF